MKGGEQSQRDVWLMSLASRHRLMVRRNQIMSVCVFVSVFLKHKIALDGVCGEPVSQAGR